MKLFICTSFTSKILPDGRVVPEYRSKIENIIDTLESLGHDVYCGMKNDSWKLNDHDPLQAFNYDTGSIEKCDLIIALVKNNPPSAGTQFELGFALALNKRILVFSDADDKPEPYINLGLHKQKNVIFNTYGSLNDVASMLKEDNLF